MRHGRRNRVLFCLLSCAACNASLVLPPQPASAPVLVSVRPDRAWAGDTVTLEGSGFGSDGSQLEVRFGGSAPVPARMLADGRAVAATVPDDADDGAVVLRAPTGVATLPDAFTFLGAGRLLEGRVQSTFVYPPLVTKALPIGDGTHGLAVVTHDPQDLLWMRPPGLQRNVHLPRVVDIATSGDGQRLAVLEADPERPADCADCAGTAVLRLLPAIDLEAVAWGEKTLPAPVARLPMPHGAESRFSAVALDETGGRAFVVSGTGAWFVEPGATPAVRALERAADRPWYAPVFVGGAQFAAGEDDAVRFFDAAAGTTAGLLRPFDSQFPILALSVLDPKSPSSGRRLAAATWGGELAVLDLDGGSARTWTAPEGSAEPYSAALSSDGERLAVVYRDHLLMFDVAAGAAVARSMLVGGAFVVADTAATFLVSRAGGLSVVAQQSGVTVWEHAVRWNYAAPRTGRGPHGWPELVLLSVAFAQVVSVDWASGAISRRDLPAVLGRPVAVAASPATPTRVVVTDADDLLRLEPDSLVRLHIQGGRTAPGAAMIGTRALMTPDGRAVLVRFQPPGGRLRTAVVDLREPWTDATATPSVEDPLPHVALDADDRGHALVAGTELLRIVDIERLLDGATDAVRDVPVPEGVHAAAVAGGRAIVVTGPEGPRALRVLDLSDGTVVDGPQTPHLDGVVRTAFAASPSGRALWWTEQSDDSALAQLRLDPATAEPLGRADYLVLPRPLGPFVAMPRAENLVGIERDSENLVVLE